MSNNVGPVYKSVVEEVIKLLKSEFAAEGVDEDILHDLQTLWETKLFQSGAVGGSSEQIQDAVYNYDGGYSSYQGLLPEHNFPHMNIPALPSLPTLPNLPNLPNLPLPALPSLPSDSTSFTLPPYQEAGGSHLPSRARQIISHLHNVTGETFPPHLGRPLPFLPHPSQPHSSLPIPSSLSNFPGLPPPDWELESKSNILINTNTTNTSTHSKTSSSTISVQSLIIPQNDGTNDEIQEQAKSKSEKLNEAKRVDEIIRRKIQGIPQLDGRSDGSSPLTSPSRNLGNGDDELDSDDDDEEEEEPETDHLILCQFEKVSRNKNKRKCNMKDGVMHLNGKDILFHKATGEFDF